MLHNFILGIRVWYEDAKGFAIEAGRQARNSAPVAVAGVMDQTGAITLDSITKMVLLIYGVCQLAYLLWKWKNQWEDRKNGIKFDKG